MQSGCSNQISGCDRLDQDSKARPVRLLARRKNLRNRLRRSDSPLFDTEQTLHSTTFVLLFAMDWSDRYNTPLTQLFSRQHKLELEWRVELALLKALGEIGRIPTQAHDEIKQLVDSGKVTLARTLEIERDTHHDIMAMVHAMGEQSKEYGGFVHLGATSQDINDTVQALQCREAQQMLLAAIDAVRAQLTRLSERHAKLTCIARTHGQHAIPITMGFKFANYLYEFSLVRQMLARVVVPAKFSGAVGTFASLQTQAVQTSIMRQLGLEAVPISTQTVSRLHLAELIFAVSATAAALERLGKEIRNLQRTEIGETHEGFGAKQVGSSTMPQKRNPHKSERVCGLARNIRSQLGPALETVSLEHERDLTNSACERITVPTALCLTHYTLIEMEKVSSNCNKCGSATAHTHMQHTHSHTPHM